MSTTMVRPSQWSDQQKQRIDEIVERRLLRERRAYEARIAELLGRHERERQMLRIEIERLRSERSIFQRLSERWFHHRKEN
jgi:hypothetical protein